MNIKIISDSTCDLSQQLLADYDITLAPLTVVKGDEQFKDGVTITPNEIFAHVAAGGDLCSTAANSIGEYADLFEYYSPKYDGVLLITIGSGFSSCYQNACLAAEEYPNVRVIDSRTVSIGAGVLAEYAYKCAEGGMGLEELTQELLKMREKIGLVAMVDTLKYLKMGGRISGTAAIAGEVLSIKPVITVRDGVIAILGKARGSKKANNFLIEQIRQNGVNYDMPILLGYTGLSDETLQAYIHDSCSLWEGHTDQLECVQLCSVVGTHAGPGAVAVAYFYDN